MTVGTKVYSKDGFTRIVLKSGSWGYRLSCTNENHIQHKQYKCWLADLWSEQQTINNGYSFDANNLGERNAT